VPTRLVFLHGPAAAGKLTVAQELSSLTGLPVFHNHLVVDALLEVFTFGSPEFVRLREQFWLATFDAAMGAGRSLIFTFAPEKTVVPGFVERVVSTVEAHHGHVHLIALYVSARQQEVRVVNPDRARFNKLNDVDTLRRLRAHNASRANLPADLTIDTDALSPQAAATQIRDHFDIHPVMQPWGYSPLD
jgi:chloramphenicol 3-O-phosphotransferase